MVKLSLVPSRTNAGQPDQYTVDLYFGDRALITRTNGTWTLVVYTAKASTLERGTFATPQDAIAVLQAEVSERMTDWAAEQLRDGHRGAMLHRSGAVSSRNADSSRHAPHPDAPFP